MKDWVIIVVSLGGLTFLALVLGGTITSGWAKSAAVVLLLIIGILGWWRNQSPWDKDDGADE